ncbi:MAG: hypothetical protein NTX71_09860 [Candidatus Aureabacteria bacterium]|nr:hypothetical protein [Candidatus Auribacterota bacterium]
MAHRTVILSDYDGLPEQSKAQAEKFLKKILEQERNNSQYRIRFSPELNGYCRRGYRGLNYQRILAIARSGTVIGKEAPTEKTREWRYILWGSSAGKRFKERCMLIFSLESEKSVVFITCYPIKRKEI